MAGLGRDVPYRDKMAWSPLLLVVGTVLQMVLLFVAFLVMLSVPELTLGALESTQSVLGTVAWMNGLSSFVASLLAMLIVTPSVSSDACRAFCGPCCCCQRRQHCSHIHGAWLGIDPCSDYSRHDCVGCLVARVRTAVAKGGLSLNGGVAPCGELHLPCVKLLQSHVLE